MNDTRNQTHAVEAPSSAPPSGRLPLQILHHVTDPYALSIRTLDTILPPTPHIATPLVQRHPAKRSAHLQPLEARRLRVSLRSTRLAVSHHHGPEALAGERGVREDGSYAGAVACWVAFRGHSQCRGGVVAAVEGLAEGPAAAGGDGGGGVDGVEDVVCSGGNVREVLWWCFCVVFAVGSVPVVINVIADSIS